MNATERHGGRFSVIPEGEKRCIWMDLGVVAYKICDRDLNCDSCPLDIGLRGTELTSPVDATPQEIRPTSRQETGSQKGTNSDTKRRSLLSRMEELMEKTNRYFHPKHTWVQVAAPDRVYIGIDNVVATILGSVDAVVLRVPGQRIRRGESCGQVIQGARVFSIRAPISGQVVEANAELRAFPNRLVLDPMSGGWLCCIAPDNLDDDLQFCRAGDAVFPWYLKELEWLDSILANSLQRHQEHLGQTMYDGGELSRNLRDLLPPEEYRHLVLSFIGKPNDKAES
jgi:glycine cleavage system H protein